MELPGEAAQESFDALVHSIGHDQCAAFIGAGLSMDVGYPGLESLLHDMAEEANIEALKRKELDNQWTSDFQRIKDRLGDEAYRKCLLRIFDHTTKRMEFNPVLLNLLQIPFCAFVTTNYDPCLEFASRHVPTFTGNRYSFPDLRVTELKGEHIFHIHGYVSPNDPDANSLVLAEDEYQEAYEQTGIVPDFLRALFGELHVVFVGFGLSDLTIFELLKQVKQTRAEREEFAIERRLALASERERFAIVDDETYSRDREGENRLGELGIRPIVYDTPNDSHYQLNGIIQAIQVEVTGQELKPLPSPPSGLSVPGVQHE